MAHKTHKSYPPKLAPTSRGKTPRALEFPSVAMRLIKLLDSPDTPLSEIGKLLRLDTSLAGELLRVANSALYGHRGRIDRISEAVSLLGTSTVKQLVLTLSMGSLARTFMRDEKQEVCWHHCVACALVSQRLAAAMGQSEERAYTAGLLHDIGRFALMARFPSEYAELLTVARHGSFDQIQCERELFDTDHCAAGAWLAEQWNLPEDLVKAIALHHSCEQADETLPSIVKAACGVSDVLGFCVLRSPSPKSVEVYIAALPVPNTSALVRELESCPSEIRAAIETVISRA